IKQVRRGPQLPSGKATHAPALLPASAEPTRFNARALARPPKPAAVPPPAEHRICPGIRFKTREQARARYLNGEYPAARSTPCNALRRHGRGSREVGDAGTRA